MYLKTFPFNVLLNILYFSSCFICPSLLGHSSVSFLGQFFYLFLSMPFLIFFPSCLHGSILRQFFFYDSVAILLLQRRLKSELNLKSRPEHQWLNSGNYMQIISNLSQKEKLPDKIIGFLIFRKINKLCNRRILLDFFGVLKPYSFQVRFDFWWGKCRKGRDMGNMVVVGTGEYVLGPKLLEKPWSQIELLLCGEATTIYALYFQALR